MDAAHYLLLASAGIVILAIAGVAATSRAGAPLLLVFLCVGMLAGEEGPGGVYFDAYETAYVFGSLALALILFDGGLGTDLRRLRGVLRPALSLATAGVIITAAITALAAHLLFGLGWAESLLMGAIVSSTDAAAVLMLIAGRDLKARPRVATTLEAESGFNDPMAVMMVVALVELLSGDGAIEPVSTAAMIVWSLAAGGAIGWLGGRLIALVERRIGMPLGLYPIFAAAAAVFLFALAQSIEASGFLAAYLAGVALRSAPKRRAAEATARFSDGIAWLAQIGLFLMLGLLVTPSHALAVAVPALGVAMALILVARPIAVLICLAPEKFRARERGFIAWMGLRGAVPIFLGGYPVLAGVENANLYFSAAFAVVIASLVIQGWTAGPVARLARVAPALEGGSSKKDVGAVGGVIALFATASIVASFGAAWLEARGPLLRPGDVAELRNALIGAEPMRLQSLPDDWESLDTEARRVLFIDTVAGLMQAENEAILDDRAFLADQLDAESSGRRITLPEQARRDRIARRYDGSFGDLPDLLARVDIIPPPLAVAQSALATGWGASEAARERNALFGRMTQSGFDSLAASAEEYAVYLNSHPAFAEMRAERARLRSNGETPDAESLARHIGAFAGSGEAYVDQLLSVLQAEDVAAAGRPPEEAPAE